MKVTLKKCLEFQAGLTALSESKMLDLKTTFAVAQNLRSLEPVIEPFSEFREDFLSDLRSKADEEGNIPKESVEAVNKSIEEALAESHNVDLKNLDLSNMDKIDVPAKVIAQILDIAEYA